MNNLNNFKIPFLITSLLMIFSLLTHSQTNVKGGIYSNTTWTKAKSPYIVIDTIVVFPGVTLTIEPGVVVRFDDSKFLEIRNGKLMAIGIESDSITFTSNSITPTTGSWKEIFINKSVNSKLGYCNILYANNGIYNFEESTSSLIIKNSKFAFNNYGINNWAYTGTTELDSCVFMNNKNGFYGEYGGAIANNCNFSFNTNIGIKSGYLNNCIISDNNIGFYGGTIINSIVNNNNYGIEQAGTIKKCSLVNNIYAVHYASYVIDSCSIKKNKYGLGSVSLTNSIIDSNEIGIFRAMDVKNCKIRYNGTGLIISDSVYTIQNNEIIENDIGINIKPKNNIYCNKICNKLYNIKYIGNGVINLSNNYWCTEDSAAIASLIFDGYDDIKYGLVKFLPFDTIQCYNIENVTKYINNKISLDVYPNPAKDMITLDFKGYKANENTKIELFHITGILINTFAIKSSKTEINISDLAEGAYFIKVSNSKGSALKMIIKE